MIALTVPYPPTINHYYGNRKNGGKYIKKEGKQFRKIVCTQAFVKRIKTITVPIAVTLNIYPPDKRKRDIDNINKALFDALEHAKVYDNDCQIKSLYSYKNDFEGNPRVEVIIEKMTNEN